MPYETMDKNIYCYWVGISTVFIYFGTSCSRHQDHHRGLWHTYYLMHLDTRNKNVYDLVNWAHPVRGSWPKYYLMPLDTWFRGEDLNHLKIFRNYLVQVVQNHPGAHNLHSIWYPMTQEHIWFRGQNPNRFEIICHFQLWRRGWPRGPDLIYLFYCPSQTI